MPPTSRVLLIVILLLAFAVRLGALFANHFHADEALFATWARLIAIWRDPLLTSQAVDKPPLLFYLQALFFPLFGPVEWSARIPNFIASLLTVPLAALLSWRVFRREAAALVAALIVALSPLAIQFSSTAFTDPLLTALLTAALLFVVGRSRPALAGLFLGLALATKHQAWLFVPLFILLAWLQEWHARQWRLMMTGLLPVLVLLAGWQLLRGTGLDLWQNQASNFGGLRLAWSWEVWPRLGEWGRLTTYAFGSRLLDLLFLISLPLVWFAGDAEQPRSSAVAKLIALYIPAYLALHWLLAVPVWDRYLLPLVPLAAFVVGRGLDLLTRRAGSWYPARSPYPTVITSILLVAILLLQGRAAIAAEEGRLPVGGRPDADQGAWQVSAYLQDAPYGTVLYDHWYSWHWHYAFLDRGVYTSWFPYPAALTEDLQAFGRSPGTRYLVLPADGRAKPVLRSVADSGYRALPILTTDTTPGMVLYRLNPSG